MPTKTATERAILAWCAAQKMTLIRRRQLSHVHARAYVVGYAAPSCLIIAVPSVDSEPQVRAFARQCPLTTVRRFDPSLKAGDWCLSAYVSTINGGEHVAIPIPEGAHV